MPAAACMVKHTQLVWLSFASKMVINCKRPLRFSMSVVCLCKPMIHQPELDDLPEPCYEHMVELCVNTLAFAGESAIEQLEAALASANSKLKEAEAKAKAVADAAAEKDAMIK